MPCSIIHKTSDFTIAVWRITESENELGKFVSDTDIAAAEQYTNAERRLQNLAWRAALRSISPELDLFYAADGAPCVTTRDLHISVSHTSGAAVIMLSVHPCGIDIERTDRHLGNVEKRFISEDERVIMDNFGLRPVEIWTAKEASYKSYRKKGVDFLRDISIDDVGIDPKVIFVRIEEKVIVPVRLIEEGEYTIAYIR